jgi:hypothetical protein
MTLKLTDEQAQHATAFKAAFKTARENISDLVLLLHFAPSEEPEDEALSDAEYEAKEEWRREIYSLAEYLGSAEGRFEEIEIKLHEIQRDFDVDPPLNDEVAEKRKQRQSSA